MRPSEEQIKQLMGTVACAACGAAYEPTQIEVLGHRDELWFLRVSCVTCMTSGLVAALVKGPEDPANQSTWRTPEPEPEPEPVDPTLDQPRVSGPVTRADVLKMRRFLRQFDGDFGGLFATDLRQPG